MNPASLSVGSALLPAPFHGAALSCLSSEGRSGQHSNRLDDGWRFRHGEFGGIDQALKSTEDGLWWPISLPHCFNELDSSDPDQPYFRGQAWYRMRLQPRNPFASARTILHFQGAGQTTTLWVGSTLFGTHKGGYDEFTFDTTKAVQQHTLAGKHESVPVTALCDNSPDPERIPSELSDFRRLVDNLGTTPASRKLQLSNGRAEISIVCKGEVTIGVTSEGLSSACLNLT